MVGYNGIGLHEERLSEVEWPEVWENGLEWKGMG